MLWLRNLKIHFRVPSQIAVSLAQPLLLLLTLGFGLGPVYAKAGNGSYIQFMTPGVMGMTVLFSAAISGMDLLWYRQFGFLKEILVAPVPRSHVLLGLTLGGSSVAVLQGTLVLIACIVVGFRPVDFLSVPAALLTMTLIAIAFGALGTAISSRLESIRAYPLFTNFLLMPLFFLSGALFPLDGLPKPLQAITNLNPLSYGVDALRDSLTGITHYGLGFDWCVLIAVASVFVLLGAYSFSKIQL